MIVQKFYPSFLVKGTTAHCQFLSPKKTQQESLNPKLPHELLCLSLLSLLQEKNYLNNRISSVR